MTTPAHPHTAMTHPPDTPHPPPPDRAAAAEPAESGGQEPSSAGPQAAPVVPFGRAGAAAGALRAAAADNLMVAIFGPMIVLLLGYSLYTTNDRFDDISNDFAAVNNRLGEINAEMNNRFDEINAEMNNRFDEINAEMNNRFDEINADINDRFGEINDRSGEINDRFIAHDASNGRRFAAQIDEVDAVLAGEIITSASP